MIKLNRTPKPVELTDELRTNLTLEFIATGKSVGILDLLKNLFWDFPMKNVAIAR